MPPLVAERKVHVDRIEPAATATIATVRFQSMAAARVCLRNERVGRGVLAMSWRRNWLDAIVVAVRDGTVRATASALSARLLQADPIPFLVGAFENERLAGRYQRCRCRRLVDLYRIGQVLVQWCHRFQIDQLLLRGPFHGPCATDGEAVRGKRITVVQRGQLPFGGFARIVQTRRLTGRRWRGRKPGVLEGGMEGRLQATLLTVLLIVDVVVRMRREAGRGERFVMMLQRWCEVSFTQHSLTRTHRHTHRHTQQYEVC